KQYIHAIFYDTPPSLTVFLPFFVFAVYAASKKFTNIGRCADICFPIFAVCMAALLGMSFSEVDWSNLAPMFRTPANRIFETALGTVYAFVEPCWLLMFLGRFKYKKGDAAKITLSYAGGAALVLLFLATFYGIYGAITPSRTFAVARTTLFFPAIDTMGRIDLILLYVMEIVMLFALILNVQLAVHCIGETVGVKDYKLISLFVNLALLAVIVFADNMFNAILNLYSNWLWIMFLVFTVLIPLLAWALRRRKNEGR
ncbi:MAG: spore germination protein, partial [Clostridia bacterium]|nr:spore germination protein [Clostridia bacterium]